jgi:hypothetical protein
MNEQINVQRVQLPDGSLIKIEGGDAAATARYIMNRLGIESGLVTNQAPPPEPLLPPVWNFLKNKTQDEEPEEVVENGIRPLMIPKIDFTRK